jgi:hypothetical protein
MNKLKILKYFEAEQTELNKIDIIRIYLSEMIHDIENKVFDFEIPDDCRITLIIEDKDGQFEEDQNDF